ncbi:MAG: hypothetical protein QNL33_09930 [Akkermansiaceae bacterium]|jgi:hypothetical protein
MNPGTTIAFLLIFSGWLPCLAEPIQHRDVSQDSPWSAHLDFNRLSDAPLEGFLLQVAGFDRILQLQTVFKQKLAVDWRSVGGVTLFGVGDRAGETAMILRGDFGGVDVTILPEDREHSSYRGLKLRRGPDWQKSPLIMARHSDQEWVAGTSLQAVKESLDLLAGQGHSRSLDGLDDEAAKELKSAAAMFSLDMKKLNGELQFEADFTRAIQRAWFLIGSRGTLVEATLMVESTDSEGLVFLQKQLQVLTTLLKSRPDSPAVWPELAGAIDVKTRGNWMTMKIATTPEQSAVFLKSLGPLFIKAPDPSKQGN